MAQRIIKLYASEFPENEPFVSFFRRPDVKTVFLKNSNFFELKAPDEHAIFFVHETAFTSNLLRFLGYFDKTGKNLPLVIAGDKFEQSYLEHLFANRPFTHVKPAIGETELYETVLKVRAGQASFLPEHDYAKELQTARENIESLHKIGMALSSEKDPDKLLELILTQSRNIAGADAGSLYLLEGEDQLRFKLSQNVSLDWSVKENSALPINGHSICGYTAGSKVAVSLLDAYDIPATFPFTFNKSYDQKSGYRSKSMLAVPMRNKSGEVLGVIQLINKRADYESKTAGQTLALEMIRPFDHDDVELLNSLASQAAVALENSRLYQDIKRLFEGFVKASIFAIESRDPTTHGHSERVAELTIALAHEINNIHSGELAELHFDHKRLTELRYASLLHDFGKVGVREEVLVKAKKLFPYELDGLKDRYRYIQKSLESDFYRECLEYAVENGIERFQLIRPSIEAAFRARSQDVQETLDFLIRANEPTFLEDGSFNKLLELGKENHLGRDGLLTPMLTERETHVLSIRRGSLSEAERIEIESHVRHTFKFLSKIPWIKDLNRIPEIAYAHHEKLNGRGYPNHLSREEIPIEAQMLCVADIFDALTAQDRPYKPAVPLQKALDILRMDVDQNHINREIVDVFINRQVYRVLEGRMFR
ncbi:MAG: HD family phosphohydrolase [Candidatus Riflebacteria bacterium HGW-Riflebacteria-1]|jgi:HD-GYP domain-containing protein (c-di-GMP phosphodiesterase class II)|nr:MAG: HD family phosphohydrolase [Candidatus Riflebacteria bacterium HGW-Riflebacteria-1]